MPNVESVPSSTRSPLMLKEKKPMLILTMKNPLRVRSPPRVLLPVETARDLMMLM